MKTLFPEPANIQIARRQANILERAGSLAAQGYRFVKRSRPTLYGIYKPENTMPKRGPWYSDYAVDITPGFQFCTCKSFKEDGDCKHRLAVMLALEALRDEEAHMAHMAAKWEEQEEGRRFVEDCAIEHGLGCGY